MSSVSPTFRPGLRGHIARADGRDIPGASQLAAGGFVLGIAAVAMIVLSCLPWISSEDENGVFSLSGLGAVRYVPKTADGAFAAAFVEGMGGEFDAVGGWTIGLGAVLLLCALVLIAGVRQGMASTVAALAGLAAAAAAATFVVAPGWAFGGESSDDVGRAYGLWGVLAASVVCAITGAFLFSAAGDSGREIFYGSD